MVSSQVVRYQLWSKTGLCVVLYFVLNVHDFVGDVQNSGKEYNAEHTPSFLSCMLMTL